MKSSAHILVAELVKHELVSYMYKMLLSVLIVVSSCAYSNYTLQIISPSNLIDQPSLTNDLKQVYHKAFSNVYQAYWTPDYELFFLKWIDGHIRDFVESGDSNKYFLAAIYKEDQVVAWALFSTEPVNKSCYINIICVDPSHWRKGLVKQLVWAVKTYHPDIELISVCTLKTNYLSPNFYEGLGFKPTSIKLAENQVEMQGYQLTFS